MIGDDRHALYVGWVLGIAMRNGVDARPVLNDDGNYTDHLEVCVPDAKITITVIVPPPPEDWSLESTPDSRGRRDAASHSLAAPTNDPIAR
jgi:hypothetical protein